ncbi:MAG: biotin transport system substrate-specific component [Bacillota bacterium]|nr:biotin transport system substrate-specific component [Bacillota bacterium]MDK2960632.1 biotin transport system substrate-specific component [Bacillota bacterium]
MQKLSLREMAYIGVFAALMTALGYVEIPLPFSPVPITGQTFGVMLAGALLGSRLGFLALAVFDLIGLVFPVFAGGSGGPGVFAGPTGGYILSWPLAAWLIGYLTEQVPRPSFLRIFGANVLGGILVVYTLGVTQLALVAHIDLLPAIAKGALPFIPGDLIKCAVAAVAAQRLAAHRLVPRQAGAQS